MQSSVKKVMLIDDNEVDLKINAKLISLAQLFNDIIICQSGEDALKYFVEHAETPELLPSFVLLDIQMPEMDGFEFLERYKMLSEHITKNCQVAMLSSTLDFGDIKRAEANPYVTKLLRKPLSIPELAKLLL